jgi:ribosome-binding protein aMBF1 (putative translation factor)
MRGGQLIREARRRAGLNQADLAVRLGTTQSAIARLERGRSEPAFSKVVEALRVCGFELVPRLVDTDESDWSVASTNLDLSPEARVRRHGQALRFARAGQEAMARG